MPPLVNPDVFNLPIKSMASRAANSIDPDQTEPTMFAKNISKIYQQKTKQTSFIVISVYSALRDCVYFSLKSAQTLMKCGNSSRPLRFAKVPLLGEITKGKQNYLVACC